MTTDNVPDESPKISRRESLKVATATAGLLASFKPIPQPTSKITLTVNGELHTVDVPEDTPLLWVLRDTLGLTGTKYGCGEGVCGACTVLLDGAAARSCLVPISAAAGSEVLTIEGLSEDGGHPLQRAWIEVGVSECGYCQPGQIITALALLNKNPNPTDEDIDRAMSGIFCRCGTYNRIRRAIHRAAEEMG